MERKHKLRVGITQGDINGVGYEVILKTLSDLELLELCTPIIFGSTKLAAYHRKALDIQPINFNIIETANEAIQGKVNLINCVSDELVVEYGKSTLESGKAAFDALECATKAYEEGFLDLIVTAPIQKSTIQSSQFSFPGHTEYLQSKMGEDQKALMILTHGDLRVALVTGHIPLKEVAQQITLEAVREKLIQFHASLKNDFGIINPRIAVLSLNPHAGDDGLIGSEEQEILIPAIESMVAKGIQCFGPYPSDGFLGSGNYTHFDGILALYHDQGLTPFKLLAMEEGVNLTAGLSLLRTSPAHGTAYGIAGKGVASPNSFRNAIYLGIDVYRTRQRVKEMGLNPLRKQYHDKRDDSHKLKLDSVNEDDL